MYFRRNKVYASWKLYKTSISVNRGSHVEVHFVWQGRNFNFLSLRF